MIDKDKAVEAQRLVSGCPLEALDYDDKVFVNANLLRANQLRKLITENENLKKPSTENENLKKPSNGLSARLRPDVECAKWVIDEVRRLEAERDRYKKQNEDLKELVSKYVQHVTY